MRLFLLGTVGAGGSCCVLLGVLRPGSPFVAPGASSWFWTSPAIPAGHPEGSGQFLGIMLVYLGIALLLGAWFETIRATRTGSRIRLRQLLLLLVAWAAPILLAPPLFSRDVYSYAGQGQLVAKGLNPYLHGPSVLGSGPFLSLVDPLWRHATAPYGPAWERLSGLVVQLSGHRLLWAVAGFRLVAVIGLALLAWGVPALAHAVGRTSTLAFTVAVLNPLVLLVLLGGAHNDALMLGLLVLGCTLAARRHPLAGLACCALAAEIKAPALIAALFIGWAWWGEGQDLRQRLAKTLLAVCFTVAVMAAIGAIAGMSWRWVGALFGAGTVVSWLDPVTAVGLAFTHIGHALGYHGGSGAFVRGSRAIGLGIAAAISIRLLIRSRDQEPIRALGWSIFAFVLLGPVLWPWYYAWAFVFLAVIAEGWTLRLVAALSAVACFADMPSPRLLISAPTSDVVIGWLVLGALVLAYVAIRSGAYSPQRIAAMAWSPVTSRPTFRPDSANSAVSAPPPRNDHGDGQPAGSSSP
ncbi:MAG: polyprenol phosphomannose-dependent alpha 1,6 mannosyltransferase MptB [Streptosporangiaceae bacterium]